MSILSHSRSWEEAFLKYLPEAKIGCWRWMGNIRSGYGRVSFKGDLVYAHRYSYERTFGKIPDGLTVDHLCHSIDPDCLGGKGCAHRSCVNPEHLEAVTAVENASRAALIARTGHCGKGHAVSGTNVYIIRGAPACRRCHLDRQHAYGHRRDHKDDIRAGGDGIVWTGMGGAQ